MSAESFQRRDVEAQRISTTDEHRWTRIFRLWQSVEVYLSLSQPHCTSLPPAESFVQNLSTSACVLQFTTNEMASVNLKCGPPLSATNSSPSSRNSTVMTEPSGIRGPIQRRPAGCSFSRLQPLR